MATEFVLYIRHGCHLCDAFIEELSGYQQKWAFSYRLVDVDSDTQLAEQYGVRVPLLTLNDEVICEYFLDPDKLAGHVN